MLIRTMDQLEAEGRVISISHGKAAAVRLLTKSDGVGFSVSEARAHGHGSSDLWYKHHWEANYIRSGRGILEDRGTASDGTSRPASCTASARTTGIGSHGTTTRACASSASSTRR